MNLHEYQTKQLFSQYGVSTPRGIHISSVDQCEEVAKVLGGDRWVVKAQVHAGGRGKAGGVKIVQGLDELITISKGLLGARLKTHQTTGDGLPINSLLIEQLSNISHEYYLSLLVDRGSERVVVMASPMGGMDIEEVAQNQPEQIFKIFVNPITGIQPYQCRQLAFGMGMSGPLVRNLTDCVMKLYKLFTEKDLSLLEINPLVLTDNDELFALDGKINVDGNALYRQKALLDMRDESQEDEKENIAHKYELNYVTLDGSIGCMVNGAGLAMATMDLIKLHGGEPANFLDVGGGITAERVVEAFKLVISDQNVKAILVNIFGGIVRCDLIADGIIQAMKEVTLKIPVIVRLEGTNVEKGKAALEHSGLSVITADGLTDAANKAIEAANG